MKTKTRTVAIALAAVLCLSLIVTAWGAVRVIAWGIDLPNRIDIQVDDQSAVQAITWFVTESARASLAQSDPEQQLQCLQAMTDGLDTNPEAVHWIQSEFAAELKALQTSPNTRVATLADKLVSAETPQSKP